MAIGLARSLICLAFLAAFALLSLAGQAIAQQPVPATPPAAAPAPDAPAVPPVPPTVAPPPAQVMVEVPGDVADAIRRLSGVMERAEKSVSQMKSLDDDIGRVRDEVETVIAQSTTIADRLRPRLADVQSQISKLGPPPAKDAAPEAPAVMTERARLSAEATALDGAIKTLELTWVKARQTIDKITDIRLAMFTRSLTERMSSPILPALWRDVGNDAPSVGRLLAYVGEDWMSGARYKSTQLILLFGSALLVYVLLRLAMTSFTHRNGARERPPTFFDRAASAAWVAPARALPTIIAMLLIYAGFDLLGMLYYPSDGIAAALLRAIILFACVSALVWAVLAPREPQWRLISLEDKSALRMCHLLTAIGAVYAADLALTSIGRVLYVPLSLSIAQTFLASLCYAGLLAALLLTPFAPLGTADIASYPRSRPAWLKLPLWASAFLILLASMVGYVALGRFIAQQLVLAGVVFVVATLLYLAIRAFTRDDDTDGHAIGRMLEAQFGLDNSRRNQLAWLTEISLTLLLAMLAIPILLLQWGFSGADIRDWFNAAIFGFEIGQFKISLARILFGIMLFTGLLFATRLFQRWMRDHVLVAPRVDVGIANSIDTSLGYLGIGIAALLAISYAGFDVTNLAIVAGALSVGIGFGLQSIVNNFVSGLILLVERPIKVGDWIVVGNEQGNVRRISVRSTEIETFDRASLIVPNAELVTGRVLNWTHRNMLGRVVIKVGVDYHSDIDLVKSILEKCARDNPRVLETPAPKAVLENFGASSLDFTLRFQLADITQGLDAQHEVRAAIFKAFKDGGVQIPGNQVEVALRGLDEIRQLIGGAAAPATRAAPAERDASAAPELPVLAR